MMALIRRLLHIKPIDTSELAEKAKEERMLAQLARSERTDKLFATIISEVRK